MGTKLLKGDCLELLGTIPDNTIDLFLTDPPYSSGGLFAGDRKKKTSDKYTNTDYNGASRFPDFSGDNMDQHSYTEFMRMVLGRCRRKTRPGGACVVFIDWRNIAAMTDALQAAGWIYRGIVVWNKGTSRNIPGRFRQDCEFAIWGTNGPKTVDWTPGFVALPGIYSESSVPTGKKHHQTEKPVGLLEKLIRICPENGCVCDPFMGSGSTGVACLNTGRNFIGMEIKDAIFDTAEKRISDVEYPVKN